MKRVSVLLGGYSAEREISLKSGRACAAALREAGYEVAEIDPGTDPIAMPRILLDRLTPRPDIVFNALHGRGGEDGTVQAILNLLQIPYTHSGLLASAIAMDKGQARRLFASAGLPIAAGKLVSREEILAGDPLPRPFVIKPVNEGSSVGIIIVREGDNHPPAGRDVKDATVLVERYIPGREVTVAVMGDRALGVLEIKPAAGWYDFQSKYGAGGSEHLYPAPIHADAYREACRIAVEAHQILGCRGISRADLRYDDTAGEPGRLYLLEVNTQPGMTETSLVPDLARAQNISFVELVSWLVENAAWDG